ncbi:ParB N-terminal domain-containing protein [Streptomyces anulatus]|uniref:ParB/RepB/Spo0J family partition protein n=1 Tax=Streptomyces anulatus TaxID=1892 RepID=UPI0033CB8A10
MASNRNDFDDFLEDDDAPDHVVDTRADGRLLRVPLGRISPNLVNPRTDFGAKEQLEDFGRSLRRRQIQAVPVVTRRAYLDLWPEHKDKIGNVDFVIVSGERRYRAATTVTLPALECVINDGYAESRKTFLDAVVSENIDRQNFDAIEEANAVEVLVEAFGSARSVAEHYERVDGWVSQRRILLRLAPEVQELVRRQHMPLEPARKLGKLVKDHQWDVAAQLQWWESEQQRRTAAAEAKKAAKRTRTTAPSASPVETEPGFTAVKPDAEPWRADPVPDTVSSASPPAQKQPAASTTPAHLPEPRPSQIESRWHMPPPAANLEALEPTGPPPASTAPSEPPVQQLPTHDWEQLADIVIAELPEEALHSLTERLLEAVGADASSQSA